jgi:hypothetical protein
MVLRTDGRYGNPRALTFRSKLVRDQRFSPKVAGSRTRLEQKLAASGMETCPMDPWLLTLSLRGTLRQAQDKLRDEAISTVAYMLKAGDCFASLFVW